MKGLHLIQEDLGCIYLLCSCPGEAWLPPLVDQLEEEINRSLRNHSAFERYLAKNLETHDV
jgi:hypothetical protein